MTPLETLKRFWGCIGTDIMWGLYGIPEIRRGYARVKKGDACFRKLPCASFQTSSSSFRVEGLGGSSIRAQR